MMLPEDDRLLDLVYASFLEEAPWQQFIDEITATVCEKAVLVTHGADPDSSFLGVVSGFDDTAVREYDQYYAARNVLQDELASRPAGMVLPDEALLPMEQLTKSEFYCDYLVPNGFTSNVGLKITGDGRRSYSLILGDERKNEERMAASASLLTRLAPHLRRAFELHGGAAMARRWALPFEALGIGAIVLGRRGEVKHVSPGTEWMLQHDPPFSISPLGRISIRDEAAQSALMRMLSRSYDGPKTYDVVHSRSKLTLVVVEKDHIASFFEGPTVIALVERRGDAAFDPRAIATAYHLTDAEVRALTGIAHGLSVDDIATRASLSRETIRLQIKSLYAKTDTHSQADILRLIHFRLALQ